MKMRLRSGLPIECALSGCICSACSAAPASFGKFERFSDVRRIIFERFMCYNNNMLALNLVGSSSKWLITIKLPTNMSQIQLQIKKRIGLSPDQYYILYNGRLLNKDNICDLHDISSYAAIVIRRPGGKGGFGSMLRAIGAQIEKTTNREACRDLSGRRLRDINEEKRLKAWIEQQAKREEEMAQRKRKKLEKLCAEPRHEFKDQRYEQERADLTERVGDAVEEGFKMAGTSGVKRTCEEDVKPSKRRIILDLDIDSDELDDLSDSSDEEDEEDNTVVIEASSAAESKLELQTSNDSGHSTDDGQKVAESSDEASNDAPTKSEDSTKT